MVLQLETTVAFGSIADALESWLAEQHGVALESAEHGDLLVEWRTAVGHTFTCQLVVSDPDDRVRRTVTVITDYLGVVAMIDEAPLVASDALHASVDLSKSIVLLLDALAPVTQDLLTLRRGEINEFDRVDSHELMTSIQEDLMPGLLIAVVADGTSIPSAPQQALLKELSSFTIAGCAPISSDLIRELDTSIPPRTGSLISVARTSSGIEGRVVPSTSLRNKLESARRLIVRRQLSAPIPFNLEKRRSSAVARLLTIGNELDLTTALEMLEDESQRANELENRLKELETQLERSFDEQDTALGDLDDALSRLRYLERAFRELGEVPTVQVDFDDDWQPESCAEALMAARELLEYLVISASDDGCAVLDGQQRRSIWAKKIWLALRALNEYCRAKAEGRFTGDINMYRDDPPAGGIPLLAEYASMESESTANSPKLKAIRTFNVPTTIDPAGKAYMEQHVKIDRGGQSAPRIHLRDDSGGPTQRIYVGYVGPHLPTSSPF